MSDPKGSAPCSRSPSTVRLSVSMRLAHSLVHRELGSFVTGDGDPPANQRFKLARRLEPVVNDEEAGSAAVELFPAPNPSFILPDFAGLRIDLVARDLHPLEVGLFSGTPTKVALDVAIERRVLVPLPQFADNLYYVSLR